MTQTDEAKASKPQKDGSTPFGQGQREGTVTQDEQTRMSEGQGVHHRGQSGGQSRPTSKR